MVDMIPVLVSRVSGVLEANRGGVPERWAYNECMPPRPPVVLFDGHCALCHGAVLFIIRRDRKSWFRFASLQSQYGKRLIAAAGRTGTDVDTIILIEGDRVSDRSTAALRIARALDRLWPLLYVFIIVPRPLRDALYRWVARHRYRWFGRMEHCPLPAPEMRERFVDVND